MNFRNRGSGKGTQEEINLSDGIQMCSNAAIQKLGFEYEVVIKYRDI